MLTTQSQITNDTLVTYEEKKRKRGGIINTVGVKKFFFEREKFHRTLMTTSYH